MEANTTQSLIQEPQKFLQSYFQDYIAKNKEQTISGDLQIPQFVEKALGIYQNDEPDLNILPSLNSCQNKHDILSLNKKLVRFECMVQDMYDEEYFTLVLRPSTNSDPNSFENALFYKYFSELSLEQIKLYETNTLDQRFAQERGTLLGISTPNINLWLVEEEKRPKSCLIKLYDENIRQFKLNEVVTFIGILEFNHTEQEEHKKEDGDVQMKDEDATFRSGIPNEQFLPQLHVVTYRRNLSINNNSVLKKSELTQQLIVKEADTLKETRDKIIAVFKLILNADTLAAEYLLLNLISRVHTRKDGFILGNLSINLTNLIPGQSRLLAAFIKEITPYTLYCPLTLENLETKNLSPKKNYDTNTLEPGVLQIPDGTYIMWDETPMQEGQIKENGLNNIKAIATLVEQQCVSYDFQYYQQSFPLNAAIVVLSDGRSMFKNTMQVAIKGETKIDEDKVRQVMQDSKLMNQMRRYFLALCYFGDETLVDFNIPADVSEYSQNIFIEVRKKEHEELGEVKTNADTFHLWLTISRLLAVSEAELNLSTSVFERARNLEDQRMARIPPPAQVKKQ